MNRKLDRILLLGFIFGAFWYYDVRTTGDLFNLTIPLVIMVVCAFWYFYRGDEGAAG